MAEEAQVHFAPNAATKYFGSEIPPSISKAFEKFKNKLSEIPEIKKSPDFVVDVRELQHPQFNSTIFIRFRNEMALTQETLDAMKNAYSEAISGTAFAGTADRIKISGKSSTLRKENEKFPEHKHVIDFLI